MPSKVDKREKLLRLTHGESNDGYVPAGFFMHFGPKFQMGQAAIEKHKEFFRFTGMDFVKIQFELGFPSLPLNTPGDWARMEGLPLSHYEPQLDVVKGLVDALKSEALVVLTLYSPFMLAGRFGGPKNVIGHLEQAPEPVAKGLMTIAHSLLGFCRECIRVGLDGFYHSTQGGESHRFKDPSLFRNYVKPSDLAVMKELNETCPFNILHICDYHRDEYGGFAGVEEFLDYPGHVVNAPLDVTGSHKSTAELAKLFGRPFMGGMERKGLLSSGRADDATEAAQTALKDAPGRFILGADCTVPGDTPWENLKAAIDVAHA